MKAIDVYRDKSGMQKVKRKQLQFATISSAITLH